MLRLFHHEIMEFGIPGLWDTTESGNLYFICSEFMCHRREVIVAGASPQP